MRNSQELKDFMHAANPNVCSLLVALLGKAEEKDLVKLATAKLGDVENIQGRIAAYRSLKRLMSPPQVEPGAASENSYL